MELSSEPSEETLRGLRICFTGLSSERERQLTEGLRRAGGSHAGPLTKDTTHLVAARVGSDKFRTALSLGMSVVEVRWLEDCLRLGRRLDERDYRPPPFLGLTITATQLTRDERQRLREAVESHGGRYEQDLRPELCTHLIAERPEGDKYLLVRHSASVRVMRKEWVFACVREKCT